MSPPFLPSTNLPKKSTLTFPPFKNTSTTTTTTATDRKKTTNNNTIKLKTKDRITSDFWFERYNTKCPYTSSSSPSPSSTKENNNKIQATMKRPCTARIRLPVNRNRMRNSHNNVSSRVDLRYNDDNELNGTNSNSSKVLEGSRLILYDPERLSDVNTNTTKSKVRNKLEQKLVLSNELTDNDKIDNDQGKDDINTVKLAAPAVDARPPIVTFSLNDLKSGKSKLRSTTTTPPTETTTPIETVPDATNNETTVSATPAAVKFSLNDLMSGKNKLRSTIITPTPTPSSVDNTDTKTNNVVANINDLHVQTQLQFELKDQLKKRAKETTGAISPKPSPGTPHRSAPSTPPRSRANSPAKSTRTTPLAPKRTNAISIYNPSPTSNSPSVTVESEALTLLNTLTVFCSQNSKLIQPRLLTVLPNAEVYGVGKFGKVVKGFLKEGNTHNLDGLERFNITEPSSSSSSLSNVVINVQPPTAVAVKQFVHKKAYFPLPLTKIALHEIKSLIHCAGSNVLPFIGVASIPPNLSIITKLCSYGNFYDLVRSELWNISGGEMRSKIYLDIARGVEVLHNKLTIHCDIKSHNVFIDHNANTDAYTAYIGDLGSTMYVPTATAKVSKEQGTSGYCAPEIFMESEAGGLYDMKVDVFSLGFVLADGYSHGLINQFTGLQIDEYITRLKGGERPGLRGCDGTGMVGVIGFCWRFDSEERPTARQVRERLQEIYQVEVKGNAKGKASGQTRAQ